MRFKEKDDNGKGEKESREGVKKGRRGISGNAPFLYLTPLFHGSFRDMKKRCHEKRNAVVMEKKTEKGKNQRK